MSPVSVMCCQMEDCEGPITRPVEFYRVCVCVCARARVSECDLETSTMRRLNPPEGLDTKIDRLTDRVT
jgi:hypothetical protein